MPIPDAVFAAMPRLSDSALRALLGLIRLSFRFDPEERQWVKPGRTFSRAAIQAECGPAVVLRTTSTSWSNEG